ncbi:Putative tannase/feruloyl esterase, alpha/Beta hydrolase [Septoria linicola]|uniref:Carboxylic ester hydrolase n=1 Tax=Septoria linicola TaxID=215465 RepID=A0A9Q9EJT5_9PEZI|nr:Putative tannase/feruloyl esterase, alpha/Beta hydrolase [Septoria linicola]
MLSLELVREAPEQTTIANNSVDRRSRCDIYSRKQPCSQACQLKLTVLAALQTHSASHQLKDCDGSVPPQTASSTTREPPYYQAPWMPGVTLSISATLLCLTDVGWNDTVNVRVWLPFEDWNGRLWALGGGGYSSSFGVLYLTQAVAKGYAAIATDSGHESGIETAMRLDWALSSPGNANVELIEDLAYKALDSLAAIGKNTTESFYAQAPAYSYFSGCSGGGRQAMTIAQRYPSDFDGILAVAPAIDISSLIPAAYWPKQVAKGLDYYPESCEVETFTQAALDACDGLDGIVDGIISQPLRCNFTAASVVGKQYSCNGTNSTLPSQTAQIVQAASDGPTSFQHGISAPGISLDANLSATYIVPANSSADSDLLSGWFEVLIAKNDSSFSRDALTDDDFFQALYQSRQEYFGSLDAHDPLLTSLRESGTKLLNWQGMADETIPVKINTRYYDQVLAVSPEGVQDYYRFFEAPGVGHCYGGEGALPAQAFDQLRAWVENGTVPEVLYATKENETRTLCPYPGVQTLVGYGDYGEAKFDCRA